MRLNQSYYICWSPRILPAILGSGFTLWEDPEKKQDNPFLDIVPRYDECGKQKTPKWGYIFERTPELMALVSKYSHNHNSSKDGG